MTPTRVSARLDRAIETATTTSSNTRIDAIPHHQLIASRREPREDTCVEQHEVARFVDDRLRERTRGADGWPIAWGAGICESHGSIYLDIKERLGDAWHFEMVVAVDRDRCDLGRALAFARQIESEFAAAHPAARPLAIIPAPITRIEWAQKVVRDHFETWAARERDRMHRGGEPWVRL